MYKHNEHILLLKSHNLNLNFYMKGGSVIKPEWFDKFVEEIDSLYETNYVVTGSSAVALYLNYFNSLTNGKFNDLVYDLARPNDVDFLYHCRGINYETRKKIGKFKRVQDGPGRSVTFALETSEEDYSFIKSFDLTAMTTNISYLTVTKYKIIALEKLLSFYSDELESNKSFHHYKQEEIKEIEAKIEESNKKRKLEVFLDLDSRLEMLQIALDKIEYKLLTLENKINIINVLKKNIVIMPELGSVYEIKQLPESEYRNTDVESHPKPTGRKLFDYGFIRELLFDSEDEEDDKHTDTVIKYDLTGKEETKEEKDIKPKPLMPLFTESPSSG